MIFLSLFYLLAKFLVYNIPKCMVGLLVLFLFFSWITPRQEKTYRFFRILWLALIIIIGLYFRLSLAYFFKGNYDIWAWEEAAKFTNKGVNIYASYSAYKYFPPWIIILGFLNKIHLIYNQLPLFFIIKLFLTVVDLITCYFLILLAKLNKLSYHRVVAVFFLNPVSIIITGFHGQFENVALLLVIIGLYLYQKHKNFYLSWLIITFGGITKHMFLNQPIFFINNVFKKNKIKAVIFCFFSAVITLSTLLPYWQEGKESIIKNLLLYSYTKKSYGMSYLVDKLGSNFFLNIYRYSFIILYFFLPFLLKSKKLASSMLLASLFFVSFTPGISDQYFVLPIALGALTNSAWLYLYSLLTSFYLFGSPAQFNISVFKIFSDNYIFLISLIWFFSELRKSYESKS